MTTTTVSIVFKDSGAGQVAVDFKGPNSFRKTFDINSNFTKDYDLDDGLYSIGIDGTSGSTTTLTVTAGKNKLVSDSCDPKQIAINDSFNVPPLAPAADESNA